jgi:hypothetical protein
MSLTARASYRVAAIVYKMPCGGKSSFLAVMVSGARHGLQANVVIW